MTAQLNRRGFLGSAALGGLAAVATAASGAGFAPRDLAHQLHDGLLELVRVPDRVAAFAGEHAERVQLERSGDAWTASAAPGRAIRVKTSLASDQSVQSVQSLKISVTSTGEISRLHLRWKAELPADILVLGDAWERSYGDLAWRNLVPERVLPWYFAIHDGRFTQGLGVKTGPGAFCFWQVDPEGVSLWLDLSNGGRGVLLGDRELAAATVVGYAGQPGEPLLESVRNLCRKLCPNPRLPKGPVYGTNDWYYAYGKNSAEGILRDTDLIVSLAPTGGTRPFSVIDAGWSGSGSDSDVVMPNPKFPDMAALAVDIRKHGARPGIWIRPTEAPKDAIKHLLLPLTRFNNASESDNEPVYDPTIPEALAAMMAKVTQVVGWKYELVKHDYSTYDLLGQWGSQMGGQPTRPGWSFNDRSKTNAEIILGLYRSIRAAAGEETLLLGCNVVGHLSAGLFEMQRTGDDTSGQIWERTRRMGVNTLSYRLAQHGAFFTMDADCVGITKDIPWAMNKQWLDLIARSGTGLFLSPSPDAVGDEQKAAIREAFAIAARGDSSGHATDWLTDTTPQHWEFSDGVTNGKTARDYDWSGEDGAWPFSA